MFRFLLKLVVRGFQKNRMFFMFNVTGLTFGLSAYILIGSYINYEKSFDQFHHEAKDIYRIARYYDGDTPTLYVNNFAALGPSASQDISGVNGFGRVILTDKIHSSFSFSYEDKNGKVTTLNHEKAFYADPGIAEFFLKKWIVGDPSSALSKPNQVVLAQSVATKYFQNENPLDKILKLNGGKSFIVSGVFEDNPQNTHLPLKVLCSISSLPSDWNLDNEWGWGNFHTYIKAPNTFELDEKLKTMIAGHMSEDDGLPDRIILQPVVDIHLDSNGSHEIASNGSKTAIQFLQIIAWVILLIALINFINLYTVHILQKKSEINIKKIIGSNRKQIISQLLLEVLTFSVISSVLAFTLIQFVIPILTNSLGIAFTLTSFDTTQYLLLFIGLILASSAYPIIILSISNNNEQGNTSDTRKFSIRHGLVLFQFILTSTLLVSAVIINEQKGFMLNSSPGFEKSQVMVVKLPTTIIENKEKSYQLWIDQLRDNTDVQSIGMAAHLPGYEVTRMRWMSIVGGHSNDAANIKVISADAGYFQSLKPELLAGRYFQQTTNEDSSVIITKKALMDLGYNNAFDALDKLVNFEGKHLRIIGILKDYHQRSMKSGFLPIAFIQNPRLFQYFTIKLHSLDTKKTISAFEDSFASTYPNDHFDFFFLDEYFNRQYQEDIRFGQITSLFSILGIVIALFGLSGLTLFSINRRVKEICIRKVLGANEINLIWLFSSSFIKLVILAFLLSTPIAFFIMKNWLENYANRVSISFIHFLFPFIIILFIAFGLSTFIVHRFSTVNPADSLRNE